MQDLVSWALSHERSRMAATVRHYLGKPEVEALQRLLEDSQGLYEITLLKRDPRDFSQGEIKREIDRGDHMRFLYDLARKVLPHLKLSNENIKYYASLVGYYSVYKLNRLNEWMVYVYLLCFIHHRYQKLHDNLANSLIYHVRRYTDEAKEAAKEQVYTYRIEGNANLHKAGQVLKLFTDDSIACDTPFHDVQSRAFGMLERSKLEATAHYIATKAKFDETAFQWEYIDGLAPSFKRQLRPVLLAVEFAAPAIHDPLMAAVHFLKTAFRKGKPLGHYPAQAFPLHCVPDKLRRYLYAGDAQGRKRLLADRYEFLIYQMLRARLEAGDIFCGDSIRFRSLEDDLLDDQQMQEKERLIAETGLTILKQPIREHLAELGQLLEERIATVNRRIASGENEHFQITRHGRKAQWTLQYPRDSEPVNNPFFERLKQVDISSVLHFVNRQCRFMDAFTHVLGRYVKQDTDERVLTACLIAWGTNMGLGRMGDISDIGYHALSTASGNFLRPETLREANDRISNSIATLPVFRHYDIGEALHSSSDGQKFETGIPTINARHSPKYFGLKKGVVSYTLVANHVPVNARIISANEHESHYVFDILFNNTTDIQPAIHSTDTHGTNEVNFALLHVFGYQFAPRYRDIQDRVRTSLYGFRHPSQYGEGLLKPVRKINENLIIEEWENFQRIILSLACKATTQHTIVGKLSAHARKNRTKRALWEYDNIIQSLYLLNYIDSPPLRRNVQKAVNRSESYHKLRRAVAYANFGKLRFRTEYEQEIWNECSRLIANCIIHYNATILSNLLAHRENTGDVPGADLIKQVSPVAWPHINLHGRFEFRRQPEPIDMEAIVQELAQIQVATDSVLAA